MIAGQRPQPLSLKRANTTKDVWSEPSSPATATTYSSLSWAAEKSAAELAGLLRNAHASLREKEKDLTLAAELGHYLLENNAALKAQYESLLQQQQRQHDEMSTVTDENDADDDDDDDDHRLYLLSQQQTHQRQLGDLQDKNMELQRLLEDAQQQSDKLQMVHDRKARELEYDITLLKDHLDLATQQIEELEQDRQHPHKQRRRCHDNEITTTTRLQQHHETVLMDLQAKIRQLEYENSQLVHTRQSVQDRLDRALYDVNALQHQFQLGQWTRDGYAQLNEAYQRQFSHIAQLNMSLEEHRHTLTSLVEHGVVLGLSHSSSSATNTTTTTSHRSIDHLALGFCHTAPSTTTTTMKINHNGNSLMAELEQAWDRDRKTTTPDIQHWRMANNNNNNNNDDDDDDDDGYSSLPDGFKWEPEQQEQSTTLFTDTACFYSSPSLMASNHTDSDSDDSDDDDDDLFGPLDASDVKTSYNLYPDLVSSSHPTYSLVAGQSKETLGMVTKVQRWCRFAIVLTVAVFINVFEGPDGMLEEK